MKTNALPSPTCGQTLLLVAPDTIAATLVELVARLALQGHMYVLDAGNSFQGYPLAHSLARYGAMWRRPCSASFSRGLSPVTRWLPCFLKKPLAPYPILILDFLSTFYDQGVRVAERQRLLQICLKQMDRLSRSAPLAVWVRQRRVIPQEGLAFLSQVEAAAGRVWRPERLPAITPIQPALLPDD